MQDFRIVDRIKAASSIEQVYTECWELTHALGFRHFLFGFRMPLTLTQPLQLILSGYPSAWRARYDEQRYMHLDPVLPAAMNSTTPVYWDSLPKDSPAVVRFFEEAASYGLAHGLTLPVHGSNTEFSLLSLANEEPVYEGLEAAEQLARRAQWFAVHVHDAVRRILLRPDAAPLRGALKARLTAREKECLRLAAEGATAAGIAAQLKIAESTVVFHLSRCQAKFKVSTRSHAIARAVAFGELAPTCYPDRLQHSQRFVENHFH